jgi:hypothetical protein
MEKTPAQYAEDAAEGVRAVNHVTLRDAEGWEFPCDAYDVVGGLSRVAMRMPQALQQVGKFIEGLASEGNVGVDAGGSDVAESQVDLQAALIDAVEAAENLRDALFRAHGVLSHLTYRG